MQLRSGPILVCEALAMTLAKKTLSGLSMGWNLLRGLSQQRNAKSHRITPDL